MGDLDDSELVRREASHADVVFSKSVECETRFRLTWGDLASTRHEVSSRAIAEGLSERKAQGKIIPLSRRLR